MKLSVVTVTCRSEPRLLEAASTLATSAQRAGCYADWLILDERHATRDLEAVRLVAGSRLRITHEPAPAHPLRTPGPGLRPALATMRNHALSLVRGDYVVWLDDCCVVTADWFDVALRVARSGKGWKCRQAEARDLEVASSRPLTRGASSEPLRPIPASVVGGWAWGAPVGMMRKVAGFDVAYDGLSGGATSDIAMRMERAGLLYCTTRSAVAWRLSRTARRDEVSAEPRSSRNVHGALQTALLRDPSRYLPSGAACVEGAGDQGAVAAGEDQSWQVEFAESPSIAADRATRCEDDAEPARVADAAPSTLAEALIDAPIEVLVYEAIDAAQPAPLEHANGVEKKGKRRRRR